MSDSHVRCDIRDRPELGQARDFQGGKHRRISSPWLDVCCGARWVRQCSQVSVTAAGEPAYPLTSAGGSGAARAESPWSSHVHGRQCGARRAVCEISRRGGRPVRRAGNRAAMNRRAVRPAPVRLGAAGKPAESHGKTRTFVLDNFRTTRTCGGTGIVIETGYTCPLARGPMPRPPGPMTTGDEPFL